MKYPAYPKYKDSGVEWLGAVPEGWDVKRLKYLASINDSALPESTNADFEFSYIDIGSVNLVDGITATESMTFENAPSRARRVVQAGDIIVSTVRTYLRAIASIPQSDETLIVSTGFAVIRPRRIESKFLNYALKESSFVENVVSRSVGVSYPAVNASEIGDIKILAPSETEQTAIADFLDSETGRIDTLVAKKRKLVALLKEKRSALISRTVTRGLPADAAREFGLITCNTTTVHEAPAHYGRGDFNRPQTEANKFAPTSDPASSQAFKDSGVEWLGEIPFAWVVKRLRHISNRITVGVVVNPSSYVSDEGVPFLLGGDVREFKINIGNAKLCLPEVSNGALWKSRLSEGDLVVVRVGYPGITAVVPKELDGANCASMMIVGGNQKFNSQWLAYLFNSQTGRDQIEIVQYGAAQKQFNISHAVDFVFPFPPLSEQTAIATYLDRETAKIDRLVAKVETAINRLQEYRSALITAAVTGKIDVRGALQ